MNRVSYKKFPIVYGRVQVRGNNGVIDIKGSSRLRILGQIRLIFNDDHHSGLLQIDSSCIVDYEVTLAPRGGRIFIKEDTFIGPNVCVQSYAGTDIAIGERVMIAKDTSIFASNHIISNPLEGYRSELGKSIVIENDVWIGANSIITAGVRIGQYSIIGAGAVVTINIPEFSMAVGNPARVIKKFDLNQSIWVNIEIK
jgi:acetyltransferase-like isoleucine patch superfamily enzyme